MSAVVKGLKTVFDELSQKQAAAVATAWERYPKLLTQDHATPKDVHEMQDVMRLIGKSVEDVKKDLDLVAEYRRLRAEATAAEQLQAQAEEAAHRHQQFVSVEIPRIKDEFTRKHQGLYARMTTLQSQARQAYDAGEKATRLQDLNPAVLAGLGA